MLSEEEKAGLQKRSSDLKSEVVQLKAELNKLNSNKEDWFQKAKVVDNQISTAISKLKELKSKRNALTEEVKKLKASREETNVKIKAKVEELKKLQKEKKDTEGKQGFRADPSLLKKEIEKLEFKVETEGLSFDKEKKLMKVINEKKKQFQELKKASAAFEKIHETSKDANVLRKVADQLHREMRDKAEQSQRFHEEVLALSKEIDALRGKEDESGGKFNEYKHQFQDFNKQLKDKLLELAELQKKLGDEKREERKQREEKVQLSLQEKEKLVEEKIKKGEKLTTEDLIVFQGKR